MTGRSLPRDPAGARNVKGAQPKGRRRPSGGKTIDTADYTQEPLLRVRNLTTHFIADKTLFGRTTYVVRAVQDVNFDVYEGETLGIVGESGCGKSVTALSLMQLVQRPQGQIVEGTVRFNAGDKVYDIAKTPTVVMEKIRGAKSFHDFPGANDEPEPRFPRWRAD